MKNVFKSVEEPSGLKAYAEKYKKALQPWTKFRKQRDEYKKACQTMLENQNGLCAYCEIDLNERDSSVEHFVPKHTSKVDENWNLIWANLFLICRGGIHDDAAEQDDDDDVKKRIALPPHVEPCCGQKKMETVPPPGLINPLCLPPFPRVVRFKSLDGTIEADPERCGEVDVPSENVEFTIEFLGLNCHRLKINRLAVIRQLNDELENDSNQRLAKIYFGNGTGFWPAFFSVYRWYLGQEAEQHLTSIGYKG